MDEDQIWILLAEPVYRRGATVSRSVVDDPEDAAGGSALVYSTYLGGKAGVDRGWGIAVDDAGSAYVIGDTTSTDFPIASPVQQAYGGGLSDGFVTKLNAARSALAYSPFLGGSLFDEGRGIAVNESGEAPSGVRAQFTAMFAPAGFGPRPGIGGIILNRWGHADLSPQPGFFTGKDG